MVPRVSPRDAGDGGAVQTLRERSTSQHLGYRRFGRQRDAGKGERIHRKERLYTVDRVYERAVNQCFRRRRLAIACRDGQVRTHTTTPPGFRPVRRVAGWTHQGDRNPAARDDAVATRPEYLYLNKISDQRALGTVSPHRRLNLPRRMSNETQHQVTHRVSVLDPLADASHYGRHRPWDIEGRELKHCAARPCGPPVRDARAPRRAIGARHHAARRIARGSHARHAHEGGTLRRDRQIPRRFFFVWTLWALGGLGGFTFILAARGLWGLRRSQPR